MCMCVYVEHVCLTVSEWLYLTLSGVNGDKDKDMMPDMLSAVVGDVSE